MSRKHLLWLLPLLALFVVFLRVSLPYGKVRVEMRVYSEAFADSSTACFAPGETVAFDTEIMLTSNDPRVRVLLSGFEPKRASTVYLTFVKVADSKDLGLLMLDGSIQTVKRGHVWSFPVTMNYDGDQLEYNVRTFRFAGWQRDGRFCIRSVRQPGDPLISLGGIRLRRAF